MADNPRFMKVLEEMRDLHSRKAADYANEDPYSNFRLAAKIAGTSVERVLMTLIGVKVARLAELTGKGKEPNYESVLDTKRDLCVYSALLCSLEEAYATEGTEEPASGR